MIELQDAYDLIADTLQRLCFTADMERIPVHQASGRVLAELTHCVHPHPAFDQSAMDGYAFAHEDKRQEFKIIGTVAAGDAPDMIQPRKGECVRIMTGAPVPKGADTVEMVENVRVESERALLDQVPDKGKHIRYKAENFASGDSLYPRGTVISPAVLAGLVTQGITSVPVVRPLRVAVASTGDEILDCHLPLAPGAVYNSNGPALSSLLNSPAVQVTSIGVLPDQSEIIRDTLLRTGHFDLVLLSGGVSMGAFDLVPGAASEAGFDQVFHKVRIKPGKPIWFGSRQARNGDSGPTLLFGLPGNPVSVLVNAVLFARPLLEAMTTGVFSEPVRMKLACGGNLANRRPLVTFIGATIDNTDGVYRAVPLKTSGSGDILRFSNAQCLIQVPPDTQIEQGDMVEIISMKNDIL